MNNNNYLEQIANLTLQRDALRNIETINRNKREILHSFGHSSMKAFRRAERISNDIDDDEVYTSLLVMYNQRINDSRLTLEMEIDRLTRERREIEELELQLARDLEVIRQQQADYADEILQEVAFHDNVEDNVTREIFVDNRRLGSITNILNDLINRNRKILIRCGVSMFALNIDSIRRLMNVIEGEVLEENSDSSETLIEELSKYEEFYIMMIPVSDGFLLKQGGLFRWTHNMEDVDLSRWGIYRESDRWGKIYADNNCLLHSLEQAGIDTEPLKTFVKSMYIPQRELGVIARIIKRYIIIHCDTAGRNLRKYGNEEDNELHIGLVDDHYFIMDLVPFTTYSIKNYFNLDRTNPRWTDIYAFAESENRYRYEKRYTDSYTLVRLLLELRETHLKPLTGMQIYEMSNYKNLETEIFDNLTYNDNINCMIWNTDKKIMEEVHPEGDLRCNEPKNKDMKWNPKKKIYEIKKKVWNKTTKMYEDITDVQMKVLLTRDYTVACTTFFDFECSSARNDKEHVNHRAYQVCANDEYNEKSYFEGDECGLLLMQKYCDRYGAKIKEKKPKSKKRNLSIFEDEAVDVDDDDDLTIKEDEDDKKLPVVKMLAHNLSYDFRFLSKYLYRVNTIEKGMSTMMSANGVFYHNGKSVKFVFNDTLKMIPMALRDFNKSFKIESQKEILPYALYTEENIQQRVHDVDYCLSFVKNDDEKDEYLENAKKWDCFVTENTIDIIKYSRYYCEMDCQVLKMGYERFRQMTYESLNVDIVNYISIASLAHDYLIIQGCYKDVLKISGIARVFMQRCVTGGRTMTNSNLKWHIIGELLADFDGVSLYPSAMVRIPGFLRGKPKIIKQFTPLLYDHYYVCIRVTKVGKHLEFPLQSVMVPDNDGNESKQFTNDLVNRIIYVDKTSLDDLVAFQKIEYEFINGYYFDDGFNPKITKVMRFLFNKRLEYIADDKNPMQLVFKLVMNSSYGKSILKPVDSDSKYVEKKNMAKFIKRNYNSIKVITDLNNGSYKVVLSKPINRHFNSPQVGVNVLSMSKRIMNEMMCLAQDLNMTVLYTDTDSNHIAARHIPRLASAFREKYGRELVGTDLGQFHTDFSLDNAVDEIFAVESYFVGKKIYIDHLKSKDKKGDVIYGHHIRCKGVTKEALKKMGDKNFKGNPMLMYEALYDGEELPFDLLAGDKPKFEFARNMTINSKIEFIRKIKCNYDVGEYDYNQ